MHPNPEGQKCCCFHPQHIIIGVCAFCLNERLLILLALKQEQEEQEFKHSNRNSFNFNLLPKLVAFTSFLSRFDSFKQYNNNNNNKKTQDDDVDHGTGASTSQEDSFISIKFEGSGVGSWEKKNTKAFNQISLIKGDQPPQGRDSETSVIIEHSKGTRGQLRWQKRIGHIFQVIRWKRPTKGKGKGHVPSNIEGHHVKVRHGWMSSLTKRRTKDY